VLLLLLGLQQGVRGQWVAGHSGRGAVHQLGVHAAPQEHRHVGLSVCIRARTGPRSLLDAYDGFLLLQTRSGRSTVWISLRTRTPSIFRAADGGVQPSGWLKARNDPPQSGSWQRHCRAAVAASEQGLWLPIICRDFILHKLKHAPQRSSLDVGSIIYESQGERGTGRRASLIKPNWAISF